MKERVKKYDAITHYLKDKWWLSNHADILLKSMSCFFQVVPCPVLHEKVPIGGRTTINILKRRLWLDQCWL